MLNILIATILKRELLLNRLLARLKPQTLNSKVEIITLLDNGEITIGAKRNKLLGMATRDYCCFIDDDDLVPSDYVERILIALERKPDCVGMCGIIEYNKELWQFRHSITVTNWCRDRKRKIFFRTPNHLNPIRREYCLAAGFPDISHGEDRVYSERIRPYLKSEFFIEQPIYYYYPNMGK